PTSEKVELSKFDKDELVKITLLRRDSTLTLTKEGEEWKADYPHEIVLKESAVDDLVYSFSSVYAEKIVDEDTKDLSDYGLEDPQATAEGELKDGEIKRFYLGDKTP